MAGEFPKDNSDVKTAGELLRSHSGENVKQHIVLDDYGRVKFVFTSYIGAVEGSPCTVDEYVYASSSSTIIVGRQERIYKWKATWDQSFSFDPAADYDPTGNSSGGGGGGGPAEDYVVNRKFQLSFQKLIDGAPAATSATSTFLLPLGALVRSAELVVISPWTGVASILAKVDINGGSGTVNLIPDQELIGLATYSGATASFPAVIADSGFQNVLFTFTASTAFSNLTAGTCEVIVQYYDRGAAPINTTPDFI